MASKKRVAAKRQAWNKGVEVGKRDAFTPAQVKRIRGVLANRGVSGLKDLASLLGGDRHHAAGAGTARSEGLKTCSFQTVRFDRLSRSRGPGESHRSDA